MNVLPQALKLSAAAGMRTALVTSAQAQTIERRSLHSVGRGFFAFARSARFGALLAVLCLSAVPFSSRAAQTVVANYTDNSLYIVDLVTGDRTVLSHSVAGGTAGSIVGTGPSLTNAVSAAIDANGNLYIGTGTSIVKVDVTTGNRTDIPNPGSVTYTQIYGLAFDTQGNLIAGSFSGAIYSINTTSGVRTTLASSAVGTGVAVGSPGGLLIDTDGTIVYTDFSSNWRLIRLNPTTLVRTHISAVTGTPTVGTGPNTGSSGTVVKLSDGSFAVSCYSGAATQSIARVDPTTGNRTILTGSATGTGTAISSTYSLSTTSDGSLYASDTSGALFRVDPTTGNRTVISKLGTAGTGPAFSFPLGILSASVASITTPAPAVTTAAATSVAGATATLNGTVNANGSSTTVTFQYGTTVSYGSTAAATPSPVTGSTTTAVSAALTGLSPNTLYHFRAVGVSAGGTTNGSDGTFTTANTATAPGAPTGATATAGNAQATVAFTAPASDGGAAITGYTVTSNPAGGTDSNAGSTSLSHVITGLTNGTSYTFTVTATNSAGTGAASTASNSVTPLTVPGAPTIGTATAGNAQATVAFTAPASNGGSAITGYTVTSSPAGGTDSNAGTTSLSHLITGLTNGTSYTFTVTATNSAGTGSASSPSSAVTPQAAIPVVTNSTLTASGTYNAAFAGYTITASNTPTSFSATGLPTGLTLNTTTGAIAGTPTQAGTFTVTLGATNTGGTGNATLTLTVAKAAATVTLGALTQAFDGTAKSATATTAPAGLTVNFTYNGNASAPSAAGSYTVVGTINDANYQGSASGTMVIIAPPVISSATTANGATNVSFTYTIVASNTPTTYSATGLPTGLSIVAGTGVISGTPTQSGTFSVTLGATNTGGTGNATLTLTIVSSPVITTQPAPIQTVSAGSAAVFSLVVTGATPITYQWYKDGGAISAATAASYGIASAQPSDAANYSVLVSNSSGAVLSNVATLTVTAAPTVAAVSAVSGRVIEFGASATLTSLFTGSGTLTYQWSKNGTTLAGQTNAAFTLASATASDAGDYTVTATNSVGNVTSSTIAVTIATVGNGFGAIRIATNSGTQVSGNVDATTGVLNGTATSGGAGATVAPVVAGVTTLADLLVDLGSTATLSAVASGNPLPTYQWFKNGVTLSGATAANYVITGAVASHAGNYTVTATNAGGSTTSAALGLTVGRVTSGGGPITFATSGGTQIEGNVDPTSGALTGSVTTSAGATSAPVVDGIGAKSGVLLNQGANATLSVAASGNPVPTYQWLKDGVTIAGATGTSFTLTNAQPTDAASYSVRASNAGGATTSAGVPVTVVLLPSGSTGSLAISGGNGTQVAGTIGAGGVLTGGVTAGGPNALVAPKIAGVNTAADLLVSIGSAVTLTSVATGNPAPTYQWLREGNVIAGATASNYTIASATAADAGNYTVRATNSGGSVTSSSLGLTIGQTTAGGGPLSFATSGGTQIAGNVDGTTGVLSGSVTASGGATALPAIDGISAKSGMLLNQGASATLTITASGNPVPTYQWLKGTAIIAGATNSSFTLTNVQPADAATYSVRATNAGGSVTSTGVPVTVVNLSSGSGPISISGGNGTQVSGTIDASGVLSGGSTAGGPDAVVAPRIAGVDTRADLLINTGNAATLTAVATGSPAPTFQWSRNGAVIPGATNSSYAITGASAADAGSYLLTATNASGSVTSSAIGVTVGQLAAGGGPVAFATSGGTQIAGSVDGSTGALTGSVTATGGAAAVPVVDGISAKTGVLLNQGASASFRASASGNPLPTYQWLRDGTVVAGATGATFALVNAQPSDAGSYAVRATNAGGSATSAGVPVTVVNLGGSSGPVTIAGGNGTVVSGAIDAAGVLTGGVTAGGINAAIAPKIGGIITRADLLVELGTTATLSAVVTGVPAPALQWFKDGVALGGATGASYLLTNAATTQAGDYELRATNTGGTVTSSRLGVTVAKITAGGGPIAFATSGGTAIAGNVDGTTGVLTGSVTATGGAVAAPVIDGITAKSGVMLNQGATATLSVAASGNPVPTYQWLKNGADLAGATGATLTFTNAQPSDAATYAVRATNAAGAVTGAGIPVTVIQLPGGTGPVTIAGGNGTQIAGTVGANGVLTGGVTTGGPNALIAPTIAGVNTSADLLVELGTAATLEAVATGSPAPAYQWFKNGAAVTGATLSKYTLAAAAGADAGNYTVTATNSAGGVTSATLGVTVARIASGSGPVSFATSGGTQIAGNVDGTSGVLTGSVTATAGASAAPVINGITAKSGVMINQGATVTFSATASGNPVPTYQWLKDGVQISGQTRASFTLTNAQPADAALYAVRATNAGGAATSDGVPVTVFSLSNSGGVSISGGNGTQVTGTIDSSGLLSGGVTAGGPGAVVAPRIAGVNSSGIAVVNAGNSLTLTTVATGSPAPGFQWYRTGSALAGKTEAKLTIAKAGLADEGDYAVVATNASGQARSDLLRVQVAGAVVPLAPRLVSVGTTPGSLLLDRGTGATLVVAASANPLPTFQWLKDGVVLPGQTGAALPIASAQSADAGRYSVRVANSLGQTTSEPIAVSVALLATVGAIEIATDGGTVIKGTVDGGTGALTGSVSTGGVSQSAAPRIVGISSNPGSIAAEVGSTATLSVAASGQPAPTIQWYKDGVVLPGRTGATLTFVNLQPSDAGNFSARLANTGGTATTGNIELTVYGTTIGGELSVSTNSGVRIVGAVDPKSGLFTGTSGNNTPTTPPITPITPTTPTTPTTPVVPPAGSQLSNLSARSTLRNGETVTAGFVIVGTESRQVLVRAVGPGLVQFGLTGVLARPQLSILRGADVVASNAGLAQASNLLAILAATRDLGAFAVDGAGADAAVLVTLPAGAYSAEVTGVGGATGQLLLELYDADASRGTATRLSNFSSRLSVVSGETLSFGLSIAGTANKRVLIRAIGPTLSTAFGVVPAVASPVLRILRGSTVIAENTRWGLSADAPAIAAGAASAGAFALSPTSGDAAVVVTLASGSYSVQVADAAAGSGSVLVEFYELP